MMFGTVNTAIDNFTVEIWAKLDEVPASDRIIFFNGNGGSDGYGLLVNTAGQPYVLRGGQAGNVANVTITPDSWHHYALTKSGTTWSLYMDGQQVLTYSTASVAPPSDVLRIGSGGQAIIGDVADLRMWTSARSQAEIQANMNLDLRGDEANLAGYWRLDDGAARDLTGNGHNGTTSGTVSYFGTEPLVADATNLSVAEDGRIHGTVVAADSDGAAITFGTITNGTTAHGGHVSVAADGSFTYQAGTGYAGADSFTVTVNDGSASPTTGTISVNVVDDTRVLGASAAGGRFHSVGDSLVAIANSASLATGAGNFTWETWVQSDATGKRQDLIDIQGNGSFYRFYIGADNKLHFENQSSPGPVSTATVADGAWHHVAAVYDVSMGVVQLYVDGVASGAPADPFSIVTSNGYDNALTFGGLNDTTGFKNMLVGDLDNTRIWNTARTAEEIQATMHGQPASGEPGLLGSWTYNEGDWSATDHGAGGDNAGEQWTRAPWHLDDDVLRFDGVGTGIDIPNDATLVSSTASPPMTIEAWVRTTSSAKMEVVPIAGATSERYLYLENGVVKAGQSTTVAASTITVNDGTWHHIAYTVDGSNMAQVYVDGIASGASADIGAVDFSTVDAYIGMAPGGSFRFDGEIADVRIWQGVRSAPEIHDNMNHDPAVAFTGSGTLAAHWTLDQGTGTAAPDRTGGNDGTIFSQTWVDRHTSSGIIDPPDTAMHFDGSSFVGMGNVLNAGSNDFTVSAWINPDQLSGHQIIVGKSRAGDTAGGYWDLRIADGLLTIESTNISTGVLASSYTVPAGQWSHVALVREGTSYSLFLNGSLVDQTSVGSTINYGNSQELRIGARTSADGTSAFQGFSGDIADVRMWDAALTEDQLWSTIEHPATGTESGLVGAWALDGDVTDSLVTGGHNGTVTGTATYVATGPLLADTTIEIGQNVPYHGSLTAVDGGGDAITWGTITNGTTAHGHVTVAADGSFTYTPNAGYFGADSFSVAANDASSHDTTATISVKVEQTVESGIREAGAQLRFDGVNDSATATVPLSKLAGTIELWLQQPDWTPASEQYIIGNGVAYTVADAVYLSNHDTKGLTFRFGGTGQTGNTELTWVGSADWAAGSWHHLAIRWENNGGGTNLNLYADGDYVDGGYSTANITPAMFDNWTLGKQSGTGSPLGGTVDDVRLWTVARSEDDIRDASDQALSGSETGLAANWTFDGDNWGATVADTSASNHDLLLASGTAAPTIIDPPNKALHFNGSSMVNLGNTNNLGTSDFTIETWINPTSIATDQQILVKGQSGDNTGQIYLCIIGGRLTFDGGGTWDASNGWRLRSGTGVLQSGEWQHVAVTRQGSSYSMYVDGNLVSTTTGTANYNFTNSYNMRIGGDSYFSGEIADFRIWNQALTGAQIADTMESPATGLESSLIGNWKLDGNLDDSSSGGHDGTIVGTATYVATGPDIHTLAIETNEDTTYRGVLDGQDAVTDILTWGTITNGTTSHGTVTVGADGNFEYTPTAGFHGTDSFTVTNSASVSQTISVSVRDTTEALGINTAGGNLQFDGVDDSAIATLAGNPLSTQATVEFWVNLQRLGVIQDLATLSDGSNSMVIEANAAGQLSVLANGNTILTSTAALTTSSWAHVAFVSSEIGVVLYVNGVQASGASSPIPLVQHLTQTLRLGSGAGNLSEAAFDEVRVWRDARSAEEVYDSYLRASPTESDNLIGRWNFNNGSSPLNDLSGYNNTMMPGGGTTAPMVVNQPGKVVKFDGTDDHMTVGPLTLTGGTYTLEAWVKPTAAKDEVILDLGRGSTSEIILRADGTGHLQVVSTTDGITFGTITSSNSLIGNQWSHVAVVNTSGAVQVLVNGVAFSMNSNALPTPNGSVTLSNNVIGWDGENTNTAGDAFAGMLSDLRVWTTARSTNDIQSTMNSRLQGSESGLLVNLRLDDLTSGTATVAYDNAVAGGATDATLVGFTGQTYVVGAKGASYGHSITVAEDTFFSSRLNAYDDVTGGTISTGYSLVGSTKTAHGSVSVATDGSVLYTPDANYNGSDSFVYQVADPQGGVATSQTITVQVTADANGSATATWGGGTNSWNMSSNWLGQETPGAETAVTISGGHADYATGGTIHPAAGSLTMTGGTLSISSGTLDLAGNASVGTSSTLRMMGGQLSGPGTLTNSGTMNLTNGSISMAVANQGLAMFDAAMLTLTAGWNNTTGTAEFGGSGFGHSVTVSGGTFVNAGTLHVQNSAGHTLSGAFRNAGLLDVDGSLMLEHGGRIIELAGGTIDVSTGGTLTIDGGTTNLTGSVAFTGAGSVNLTGGHTLDVGSGYTHTGGKFLGMGGNVSVVGSGSFTNAGTLTVNGDSNDIWNVAVANSGQLNVLGSGMFNVANGFSNTGTIELNGNVAGMTGGINVTGGTLVNQAGGVIHVVSGQGTEVIFGAFRTLGRLDLDDDMTLSHNGAVIDLAGGTIDVASGTKLTIDGGTTKLSNGVALIGDGTLDFAGIHTLDIGTGYTLTSAVANMLSMSGSVTIAGSGTFTNQGSITLDKNDDHFAAALTNTGTIDVFGGWRNGNVVSGALNVYGGMVNTGLLMLENGSALSSQITVGAGVTLTNQGSMVVSGSYLSSISGAFDNQGSLIATSNLELSMAGGTVTNSGSMTLAEARTLSLSGGASLLNTGVIDSSGTITFQSGTLTNQGTLVASGTGGVFINGAFAMSDDAELDVSVQGAMAPVATSLHMNSGNALLDGTLKVSFVNHMPMDGQSITVVYGTYSGTFDEMVVDGLGADWTASLDYSSPSSVTVTFHMVDMSSFDATSGAWGTVANWVGSDLPSSIETAQIGAGKSVLVDTAASVSSLADAGTVSLVAGGTLTVGTTLLVASGGKLDLSGGVLSGDGNVIVEGTLSLNGGTIANGGDMEVYSSVNMADAAITLDRNLDLWGATILNDAQFSGSGNINLAGNSTLSGYDSFAAMVYNDGTMTLGGGGGAMAEFHGDLRNNGVIVTTGNLAAGYSHFLDGLIINDADGLIHVTEADLTFTGNTLVNHGTLSIDMNRTFDVNRAGAHFDSDGLLTGSGTLDLADAAPFTNHGTISGSLTIEGDVVLANDGKLDLPVGATSDRLDVNGHLILGGELDVSSASGGGGAASLVTWDSANGYFDAINGLDQGANGILDISFGNTGLSVTRQTAYGAMTSGNDSFQGSAVANYVGGTAGDDTISGNGGADVLFGGEGNDHLHITDGAFHFLDGGTGTDTLHLEASIDFSAIRDDILQNFEVMDLTFAGNQTVTLNASDLAHMCGGTNAATGVANSMVIIGNAGDTVNLGTGWTATADQHLPNVDSSNNSYTQFANAATGVTVYVDDHVTKNTGGVS